MLNSHLCKKRFSLVAISPIMQLSLILCLVEIMQLGDEYSFFRTINMLVTAKINFI